MLKRLSTAIAAAAFVALPAKAQDVTAETVLATVNGIEITVGHMIVARASLPPQYQQIPAAQIFQNLLDQMIGQAAIASGVDRLSKRSALVLENERRSLIVADVLTAEADAALTEEALVTAYEASYSGAEPAQEFNASHILVADQALAQELRDQLDAGADFAELARAHSTGPTGSNGGNLGWFEAGAMVPEFEAAIIALSPGELGGPVQTQFGWHVVKLNEVRQKDAPTLDQVRGELVEQVQRQAISAFVTAATEVADIEVTDLTGLDPAVIDDASLLEE